MAAHYKWLPVVSDYCTGCGNCVEVCRGQCLETVCGSVTLQRPDVCISEGECVEVCPHEGVDMKWVKMTGNQDVGLWCEIVACPPRS